MGQIAYIAEEIIDTIQRNLGLDYHRYVVEGHPHLVS